MLQSPRSENINSHAVVTVLYRSITRFASSSWLSQRVTIVLSIFKGFPPSTTCASSRIAAYTIEI